MKNTVITLLVALFIISLVGLGIWYEIAMWTECRLTNSFWYCMRVLSK